MIRPSLLGTAGFLLLGCGDGDSLSPTGVPDVAGTYHGEFIVTSSSAAGNQNLGTFPATATISQQKSNLSIIIVPPQGGALTFSGTIAEGGATTLDSEAGLMFLEGELPECSFEEATTASEAIPDAGSLTLTAAVAGASCTQGEDGGLLTTEFSVRFQGTEAEAT